MKKRLIVGLVLLFVSGLTFYKMLHPGFYPMHDDMQAMRLLQMHDCITDGQIPCRWVPDMGYGYGYPQFNYYSPLPYYVMEVFHLMGLSILTSVKIGFILTVLMGIWGMYLLSSSLWGIHAGIISACFFALLPYRAVDMWVRGAMGELWGLMLLPFVFLAIRKAVYKVKNSEVLLAVVTSLLFMSHNISVIIFLPFIILWTAYLLVQKYGFTAQTLNFKNIFKIIIGFLWGFLISAYFVLPAWFEKNLVQINTLTGGYFDYRQHFASIAQIFTSTYWNYGSSQPGIYDEIFLGIGILHWTIALTSLLVFIALKRRKTIKTVLLLIVLAFVASFMAHPKSSFIWNSLGIIKYLQFPWRYLLAAGFLFSLAAGSITAPIRRKRNKARLITVTVLVLAIFFNASYFRPVEWLNITDTDKFSGKEWLRQQTISIYDYLPVTVKSAPNEAAELEPMVISGEGQFSKIEKGSDWYRVTADVFSDDFLMQLPVYFFPNWTVEVNDVESDVFHDNELGLITIQLDQGVNEVYAELNNTPVRKISNLITLFSILFVPYYLTMNKNTFKKKR
ncbi:hypothetical protein JXA63_01875 [Candidatus Woesebacteria bacterium]|nr:hypothetical protein [Candidatus Woesebacteria bacterium]